MEESRLKLLEGRIKGQMQEITRIFAKVGERKENFSASQERVESLAYQLHNLYCAFEDLMELVADAFENQIESRVMWHANLLRRMKVEIAGVRPALFSEKAYNLLDELRQFRHTFRHAYGRDVDVDRLRMVLDRAMELKQIYEAEVSSFLAKLRSA